MPTVDNASINGLFSTPLVLPAPVAGALAALFVVLLVLAVQRAARGGESRLLLGLSVTVVGALAFFGILDRLATAERAAEGRALLGRSLQLSMTALAPGSPLACLDSAAGEQVENACEKAIFADAQTTASAVAYMGARLVFLADAAALAQRGDSDIFAALVSTRRAIELDRFGIAAYVLAVRDGCTAEHCAAFAILQDATTLKANLKANAFDTYVARYASAWGQGVPVAEKQPQSAPVAGASQPSPVPHPVDSRYDFPSAASIPRVSIMNAEPSVPKEQTGTVGPAAAGSEKAATNPPPPKRPQAQAASPPPR